MTVATTHTTLLARLADSADSAAWNEFCARYGDLIRGFARRRNLQPNDCDDIVQEVLVRLTRFMPTFEYDTGKGRFRSYLKVIVLRAILERNARKSPSTTVHGIEDLLHDDVEDVEIDSRWEEEWKRYHVRQGMHAIALEFNSLDVRAFEAYAIAGRPVEEVAHELMLTVSQVYRAKSLILKRLCQVIAQQVEAEG